MLFFFLGGGEGEGLPLLILFEEMGGASSRVLRDSWILLDNFLVHVLPQVLLGI